LKVFLNKEIIFTYSLKTEAKVLTELLLSIKF
jgi:hypothetical protein